jgi:acetyl/propionyl-CoA carboxylase alpha subunit
MSVNLTKEQLCERLSKLRQAYANLERERDHHVAECRILDRRVKDLERAAADNEDWLKAEVRKGGALVRVRIERGEQVWTGERIVSALDMHSSVLTPAHMVKHALSEMIDGIDIEPGG